jgi:hypothetical protein
MKFAHLFSWSHVINNYKPFFKAQGRQNILDMMCRAMQEFHLPTYKALMAEIKKALIGKD